MDGRNFDSLTKDLTVGRTRREMLRLLAGGALGLIGSSRVATAEAKGRSNKVTICRWDAKRGRYREVTERTSPHKAQRRHTQDIVDPDFTSPATCGDCNTTCPAGKVCVNGGCRLLMLGGCSGGCFDL